MDRTELAMARGMTLTILQTWLNRPRETSEDSLPTYMVDDLLLRILAQHGYPMLKGELNGAVMTYLKDQGFVEYRMASPFGPKVGPLLYWRIAARGMQLLEGAIADPGVALP